MLDELISYSYENKRKFDIVAALGMALLANEEMLGKVARTQGSIQKLKFGYNRNTHGQIQLGDNNDYQTHTIYGKIRTRGQIYNRKNISM